MKKTLFMIMSVDGKISTGASDSLDIDIDFPHIPGLQEGLYQYYEIESSISYTSFNTGRTMAKIGVNTRSDIPKKIPCTFIIVDNQPHLTSSGLHYLCTWLKRLILITTNPSHPAFTSDEENLHIIYQETLDLAQVFHEAENTFDIHEVCIQSGASMNGRLIREHLIDYVDVVIAPVLIGGKDTATLADGESLQLPHELALLETMTLQSCTVLQHHYIRLQYAITHRKEAL